jgi:hypothetical protein
MMLAVDFFAGAVVALSVRWLFRRKKEQQWEPFEPGVCDELPLHAWGWSYSEDARNSSFWCPACAADNGQHQPPYCPERGGHFHFKCVDCGYEWAMRAKECPAPSIALASCEVARLLRDVRPYLKRARGTWPETSNPRAFVAQIEDLEIRIDAVLGRATQNKELP